MADDLNFIEEIEDSLRVENMERFWKENGKLVVAGCIAVVLFTIASGLWKSHMHTVHAKETELLLHADSMANSGKPEEAEPAFAEAEKGSASMAALAKFREAEMFFEAGNNDKALALYKKVSGDKSRSVDAGLRDLALLRAEQIEDNVSKGKTTFKKNAAFDAMTGEIFAVQLMNAGKNKEAHDILSNISQNNTLPKSQRMRAYELMGSIPEGAK